MVDEQQNANLISKHKAAQILANVAATWNTACSSCQVSKDGNHSKDCIYFKEAMASFDGVENVA